MSQVLNAQDLADELHDLSDLPVVIAGIEEDGDAFLVRIGWAGTCTSDVEAVAAALLSSCKASLEMLVHSTPSCRDQLDRISASLNALKPLGSAAPKREVH